MTDQREDSTEGCETYQRIERLFDGEWEDVTPQDSPEARISEIREREKKAMRGPWVVAPCPDDSELCEIVSDYSEMPNGGKVANWIAELDSGGIDTSDDIAQMHDNATFIAHARDDISYLLARLHEQAQEIERLKAFEEAIIDAGIVEWTYRKEHETNPRLAIAELLASVEQQALNPAISKPAHDLVTRAEAAEAEIATLKAANRQLQAMLGIAELHVTSKDFCPACGRNYATEATS